MCLAVPGKVLSISGDDPLTRSGKVSFGGVIKDVNFAFTPDARVDDYVLVHVGFAINKINAEEAERVFELLKEIEEIEGLQNDTKEL